MSFSKFKVLLLILLANTAVALEGKSVQAKTTPYDVVVPSMSGNPSNPVQGQIYYDTSAGTAGAFKAINKSGAPDILAVSGSNTVTSSGTEKIERATVICGSSSSVTSQSGSWISSVGNSSGNRCTITIASGVFNYPPVCVAVLNNGSTTATTSVNIDVTSSTSITFGGVYNTGATTTACAGGESFNFICMGN